MPKGIFSDGWTLKITIVVPPEREYFAVDDLKRHNIKMPANVTRAKEQHLLLRNTLRDEGVKVVEIAELKGHPNSVFAMDTSLSLGDSFIILRMGLESRRGEETWMAKILSDMGLEEIGRVVAPGTAEGGDLIPAYPYFFIGRSSRTNDEGVRQISKIVENYGYETIKIKVPEPHLHLGGAMSLVDGHIILACNNLEIPQIGEFNILRVRCKTFISGNVINLGKERVILEKRNYEVRKILEQWGFRTIPLDLSEFVKGSGGPSCLVLPVLRV